MCCRCHKPGRLLHAATNAQLLSLWVSATATCPLSSVPLVMKSNTFPALQACSDCQQQSRRRRSKDQALLASPLMERARREEAAPSPTPTVYGFGDADARKTNKVSYRDSKQGCQRGAGARLPLTYTCAIFFPKSKHHQEMGTRFSISP